MEKPTDRYWLVQMSTMNEKPSYKAVREASKIIASINCYTSISEQTPQPITVQEYHEKRVKNQDDNCMI